MRSRLCALTILGFFLVLLPSRALAWGANAERLIANRAVDTLPRDLRPFFDANRAFLTAHAAEPLEWLQKNPETERPNHILFVDHYGKFSFEALPRTYKAA